MKRIKYIVSYSTQYSDKENRLNILASTNKVNYIVSVLNDLGYGVDIISTSHTLNKKCYKGHKEIIGNNTVRFFPTTWRGGILFKILNQIIMRITISFYLLGHVSKKEKILIYHSYGNLWLLKFLKILKKAYIIEEVEEIYGDIFGDKKMSKKEISKLKIADAYIYPTILLNDLLNFEDKPYIVVHGSYKDNSKDYFSDKIGSELSFEANKFHIGYTGILDPRKGCINILKAAKYLNDEYHIHILGFGDSQAVLNLIKKMEEDPEIKCKLSFDGVRRGEAYSNYLKHLDAGICPVDATQDFINTQFPSKIITYLTSGLPVISSKARSILTCDVKDAIFFYDGNTPKDIAEAIIKLKNKKNIVNIKSILNNCDKKFHKQLKKIIN